MKEFSSYQGQENEPVRRCIICKKKRPKRELIRFIKKSKEIDILKSKGGRGMYVCPSCIHEKKLKKMMNISTEQIKAQLEKQITNLIQIGWRGRIIKIGYNEAEKALKKGKKGFLIIAEDVAERTKRNILRVKNVEYFQIFNKLQLGSFIGKKEVGIIFVPETKFGLKLKGLIAQYIELKRR